MQATIEEKHDKNYKFKFGDWDDLDIYEREDGTLTINAYHYKRGNMRRYTFVQNVIEALCHYRDNSVPTDAIPWYKKISWNTWFVGYISGTVVYNLVNLIIRLAIGR